MFKWKEKHSAALTDCEDMTATHVFVRLNATLSQTQPQPRTDVVQLHRLDEAVERGGWTTTVQQLHAHVVQQLVVTTHTQRLQLAPGQLFA